MHIVPRATASATPTPYVVTPSQEFDGNDGSWSTFSISVGTPGQDLRLLPSTKSGETYVIVPEGCIEGVDPDGCPNARGADVFNSEQSPGFQLNMSSTWSTIGQYSIDLEQNLNYTGQGIYGYDKVALGAAAESDSLSLDHQVVAGVADLDYYMGYLPLGVPDSSFSSLSQSIDSFMMQLRNESKIPSLSFGYTAGAKYRLKSVYGNLILGGYDSTRFTPNENPNFSFTFSNDPSRLLTVGVDSITATNSLQGTYSLTSSTHFSLVDSSVPHLWLPRDVCDSFEAAFGLTYDPQSDLYLVNDTIHSKLQDLNPTITIKLVNSLTDTSSNYTNIELPYAAFDLQASYPYYTNTTNYFPIRRAANDTQYTLARTLLQEAYLIVDYERGNFSVSQATFSNPLPAAKVVTIKSPLESLSDDSSSSTALSTGAIAGIAVGGAVLVILIIVGAVLFCRRRRKNPKTSYELANTQFSEAGSTNALSTAPHKSPMPQAPQEIAGSPLAELASPHADKPYVSPTSIPQELPTPIGGPGWRSQTQYFEMDASDGGSRPHSLAPSEDSPRNTLGAGTGTRGTPGVSPLTPSFHFSHH